MRSGEEGILVNEIVDLKNPLRFLEGSVENGHVGVSVVGGVLCAGESEAASR